MQIGLTRHLLKSPFLRFMSTASLTSTNTHSPASGVSDQTRPVGDLDPGRPVAFETPLDTLVIDASMDNSTSLKAAVRYTVEPLGV
jgi:hypothetical protein